MHVKLLHGSVLFAHLNLLSDTVKCRMIFVGHLHLLVIIIHQTHYEKSDWWRAFSQFTIAGELDMINAISAADIAFIMSSSTSAWLPSPLECSPQKQKSHFSTDGCLLLPIV